MEIRLFGALLAVAFSASVVAAFFTTDRAGAMQVERSKVPCSVKSVDHKLKVLVLNCRGEVLMFSGPALERLKIGAGKFASLYPGSPLLCGQSAKLAGLTGRNLAPNGGYHTCG